jgi:GT2 family glycosyltransferase
MEQMLFWANLKPEALLGALDVDMNTKKPYYGGELIDWKWDASRFLLNELSKEDLHGLHQVSLFPGRGLLIPRIVFDTVGLFEETKLPHYLADYDFTQMARRHGFKIYCNYDAKLYTYPSEGGDHRLRARKNLKNYFLHLFGIRGGGNLKNFTIYTFRNCPKKYLLPSLLTGYVRRIGGYWFK